MKTNCTECENRRADGSLHCPLMLADAFCAATRRKGPTMKTIVLFATLLTLSACGSADYYHSDADRARDAAFDNAMAAGLLSGYAASPRSCMNIGGIVTCQ